MGHRARLSPQDNFDAVLRGYGSPLLSLSSRVTVVTVTDLTFQLQDEDQIVDAVAWHMDVPEQATCRAVVAAAKICFVSTTQRIRDRWLAFLEVVRVFRVGFVVDAASEVELFF